MMTIGVAEVALLLVVSVGAIVTCLAGRNWFYLGVIPLFAAAMIVTPADPLSCLLVGAPLVLIYGLTVCRLNVRSTSADD